jgi:hypothetical protein
MKDMQAFPIALNNGIIQQGMTLRDYFAGQVIQREFDLNLPDYYAKKAYEVADEMIKERENENK